MGWALEERWNEVVAVGEKSLLLPAADVLKDLVRSTEFTFDLGEDRMLSNSIETSLESYFSLICSSRFVS